MTDGRNNLGMYSLGANVYGSFTAGANIFGGNVGTSVWSPNRPTFDVLIGVTPDPTKSGIVASLSGISVGEINSLKLGKYILKY